MHQKDSTLICIYLYASERQSSMTYLLSQVLVLLLVAYSVHSLIYEPNHCFFKTENSKVNMTYKCMLYRILQILRT